MENDCATTPNNSGASVLHFFDACFALPDSAFVSGSERSGLTAGRFKLGRNRSEQQKETPSKEERGEKVAEVNAENKFRSGAENSSRHGYPQQG